MYVSCGENLMSSSFDNILPFFPSKKVHDQYFTTLLNYQYLYNVSGLNSLMLPLKVAELTEDGNAAIAIYELLDFGIGIIPGFHL